MKPLKIQKETILGDVITPVQAYMKLRDQFPNALLLESSDYHSPTHSYSFLCLNPIASFVVDKGEVEESFPHEVSLNYTLTGQDLAEKFKTFSLKFTIDGTPHPKCNGFFGYSAYDAMPHFEKIKFNSTGNDASIPEFRFSFYQNIIVFNHYNNEITFLEYLNEDVSTHFKIIKDLLLDKNFPCYPFKTMGEVTSNFTDEAYIEMVEKGIASCFRGDVFQIVLSRQFQQEFKGDEFNVYRALRAINPSPYLFYYDYGSYKIFGSSPEAQIVIQNNIAEIDPIAGTFIRTGDAEKDAQLAIDLAKDPKENAEHVMLVDLARNDLSRNSSDVKITRLKEIQYFSHVIHMVSKVQAVLDPKLNTLNVFADTFPAGTLSGAPKYKAMQLIDTYEVQNRGIYGGALGYIGLDGSINTAITIRTFISKQNHLYFQAGAGVVSQSVPENELQEVNNKLAALRKAIVMAEGI